MTFNKLQIDKVRAHKCPYYKCPGNLTPSILLAIEHEEVMRCDVCRNWLYLEEFEVLTVDNGEVQDEEIENREKINSKYSWKRK